MVAAAINRRHSEKSWYQKEIPWKEFRLTIVSNLVETQRWERPQEEQFQLENIVPPELAQGGREKHGRRNIPAPPSFCPESLSDRPGSSRTQRKVCMKKKREMENWGRRGWRWRQQRKEGERGAIPHNRLVSKAGARARPSKPREAGQAPPATTTAARRVEKFGKNWPETGAKETCPARRANEACRRGAAREARARSGLVPAGRAPSRRTQPTLPTFRCRRCPMLTCIWVECGGRRAWGQLCILAHEKWTRKAGLPPTRACFDFAHAVLFLGEHLKTVAQFVFGKYLLAQAL